MRRLEVCLIVKNAEKGGGGRWAQANIVKTVAALTIRNQSFSFKRGNVEELITVILMLVASM